MVKKGSPMYMPTVTDYKSKDKVKFSDYNNK